MNGREVFRFASRVMVTATEEVIERAGLTKDDIDVVVPHQANLRIIQAAARGLRLPMEKFVVNIERYGNTSTASIPIAVAEAVERGQIKPNDKVILVGFGGGLTWGALLLEWDVQPTPASYGREVLREGWYIVARIRSLFRRMLRFLEAMLGGSPTKAALRDEERARRQLAARTKDAPDDES
jgi:3-oxoacyl-[acyl-carrier-protein] synthase-3